MISAKLHGGLVALLVALTFAALATTPINSGWTIRAFTCDLGGSPDWLATVLDWRHLISFGVLAALAFVAFRNQPMWMPVLFLLAITGAVELEEGLFAAGHCRLRDMIPDVLAIALGWLAALAIARLTRR